MFSLFCISQPLASTYPGRPTAADRLQTRITDLERSAETRRSAAAELLAKDSRPELDKSGSDSEMEAEDDELAQNSDSAVGKLRQTVTQFLCCTVIYCWISRTVFCLS